MAHDVTVGDKELIRKCKEALAERIGLDRFDVWFGNRIEWKIAGETLKIYFQDIFTRDWCFRRFHSDVHATIVVLGDARLTSVDFDVAANSSSGVTEKSDTNVASGEVDKLYETSGERLGLFQAAEPLQGGEDSVPRMAGDSSVQVLDRLSDIVVPSARQNSDVVSFPNKEERRPVGGRMSPPKQRALIWENFVVGTCNRKTLSTVQAIVQNPGSITPLLLCGPCGSGKTHLAHAIAAKLRQAHGLRRVLYLSSEQFTNDFMEAIRGSGLPSFRKKYRDVECLILDDIQFLAGKRATLQELKHTLDTLLRQGRQIILVADRSLQELSILGTDIYARLTGGIACALEGLDEATRYEVLSRLLADFQVKVSSKIVRELSAKSSGDARVLFGLVNRLRALSLMLGGSFSDHQAIEATQDLLSSCQPSVRLSDIEKAVCDVFGLEPKSLQAKGKTKTVSQPRMLAMFLARKYTRAAYAEIGDYFGRRRHSTVISAEKKVSEWLSSDSSGRGGQEHGKMREALKNVEASLRVG
jgi:chromosomal replication initiator protein